MKTYNSSIIYINKKTKPFIEGLRFTVNLLIFFFYFFLFAEAIHSLMNPDRLDFMRFWHQNNYNKLLRDNKIWKRHLSASGHISHISKEQIHTRKKSINSVGQRFRHTCGKQQTKNTLLHKAANISNTVINAKINAKPYIKILFLRCFYDKCQEYYFFITMFSKSAGGSTQLLSSRTDTMFFNSSYSNLHSLHRFKCSSSSICSVSVIVCPYAS